MPGQKFLQVNTTTGNIEENISTQIGGAGNEDSIPSLDAAGKLDATMMPTGIGADVNSVITKDALGAGDFVNIYFDATDVAVRCRKADGTTVGKEANGFVLSAFIIDSTASVYSEGSNTSLTGLDDGNVHFLSTIAGQATSTVPTTSGNIVQRLGRAVSDTTLVFEPSAPIKLV